MKVNFMNFVKSALMLTLALSLGLVMSCTDDEGEDDEVTIFAPPTIAVIVDNSEPFQGDTINFTITVSAEAGLTSVTLNGDVIKEYNEETLNDEFSYAYLIPEEASTGPTAVNFMVTDAQAEQLMASREVSITVQNSDLRGEPVVIADFQNGVPGGNIEQVTFDSGPNSWEAAYAVEPGAEDPENSANLTLKANRLGAHEWYFQGGGAVFIQTADFLSEEDVAELISGERVLQMNMYFEELPRVETVVDPTTGNEVEADLSYQMNSALVAENYTSPGGYLGWNYDAQDSVPGITVRLELGNNSSWAWNDGDPLGKKFFVAGTITEPNTWQTVTFSTLYNAGTEEEPEFLPRMQGDGNSTYVDDTAVGNDQLDYMAMILNNRITDYPNPDGYVNGDGEVVVIEDTHNAYYIDNIRTIAADAYDQNPNQ